MLSIRLLLVAKDFNRFCWLDFHPQTRLYGNWKFFQQICAVTKSIKTRILFIMCSLCHLLLLLYFVHLTIKLFILSFCMASPSFHTCEKLSFHYKLCSLSVCVRVRGAHIKRTKSASNFHTHLLYDIQMSCWLVGVFRFCCFHRHWILNILYYQVYNETHLCVLFEQSIP